MFLWFLMAVEAVVSVVVASSATGGDSYDGGN
jgi:hypothetical protein